MSSLTIHTRCLSVRDPWGTYLSMHLSRRTTQPSIIVIIAARYVPRNIISMAARDTNLENSTSSSTTTMSQIPCNDMLKWKGGDNHLITKHNLQQEIQHQKINNKSPNHSQHHTRKYTNFVRLTSV